MGNNASKPSLIIEGATNPDAGTIAELAAGI
jgi:hypothetical protein